MVTPVAAGWKPRGILTRMGTALWLRNPIGSSRLSEQLAMPKVAWNAACLRHHNVSVDRFNELHFPVGQPFDTLVIDADQTIRITPTSSSKKPHATYPSWAHGQTLTLLESYLREEHELVVIVGIPPFMAPFVEQFYIPLSQLQEEWPKTQIHLNGGNGFRQLFGLGYASVDYDPLTSVALKQVMLPCGAQPKNRSEWAAWGKWFRLIGYDWREINTRADMAEFNITSAHWAAEHFRTEVKFAIQQHHRMPKENAQLREEVPEAGDFVTNYKRRHASEGDMIICDACSLATACKLYREGAVCTLPESPSRDLAKCFKSRDSDKILEGLAKIMAIEEERFQEGRSREKEAEDGLDPEVSKMLTTMFHQGVQLAKLRNPALLGNRTQVNVGVAFGNHQATPAQMGAAAIAQLEAQGWTRESITRDMVERVIRGEDVPKAAIEVESYEVDDDDQ
jgi:hypothetical protein